MFLSIITFSSSCSLGTTPQLKIITISDNVIFAKRNELHLCTEMCHEDFASLSEEIAFISIHTKLALY